MHTTWLSRPWITGALVMAVFATGRVDAAQFGNFTYVSEWGEVTITAYTGNSSAPVVIPDSIAGEPVRFIGPGAFMYKSSVQDVTVPEGVWSIGDGAFALSGVSKLTLPSSLMEIGSRAFADCWSLKSFDVPAGVVSTEGDAFVSCINLESFTVNPSNPQYRADDGVLFYKSMGRLVSCPPKRTGVYVVPASVQFIGDDAFFGCAGLTGVQLPAGLKSIGGAAFYNCTNLAAVDLPAGLQSIFPVAFAGTGLVSVNIPASVNYLVGTAFQNCARLSSIHVDPANTSFKTWNGMLMNKGGTTLVACPPGWNGGTAIFPDCMTKVDTYALKDCKLTGARLPASLTTVEAGAFQNCDFLEAIVFSGNITSVKASAFFSCNLLRRAYFQGSAPSLGTSVFGSAAAGFTVYFQAGATGFTSPLWGGYPSAALGMSHPAQSWLLANALPHDSSLSSDTNGDGVSLLMAYALGLDPGKNLAGSVPKAGLTGGSMSLEFPGTAEEVTYRVEASTDMVDWSAADVELTTPDVEGIRKATWVPPQSSGGQSGLIPCLAPLGGEVA